MPVAQVFLVWFVPPLKKARCFQKIQIQVNFQFCCEIAICNFRSVAYWNDTCTYAPAVNGTLCTCWVDWNMSPFYVSTNQRPVESSVGNISASARVSRSGIYRQSVERGKTLLAASVKGQISGQITSPKRIFWWNEKGAAARTLELFLRVRDAHDLLRGNYAGCAQFSFRATVARKKMHHGNTH